jgi:hypothetical protein
MSLSPSHDRDLPVMTHAGQAKTRPVLSERAVALAFLAAVSAAMLGWLYLLAVALRDGVGWLVS